MGLVEKSYKWLFGLGFIENDKRWMGKFFFFGKYLIGDWMLIVFFR